MVKQSWEQPDNTAERERRSREVIFAWKPSLWERADRNHDHHMMQTVV